MIWHHPIQRITGRFRDDKVNREDMINRLRAAMPEAFDVINAFVPFVPSTVLRDFVERTESKLARKRAKEAAENDA